MLRVQCLPKVVCASANMWLVHLAGRAQEPGEEMSSGGSRLCGSTRWVSAAAQARPPWAVDVMAHQDSSFPYWALLTILSSARICCDMRECGIWRCHLSTNSTLLWKWDHRFPLDSRSFEARAGLTIRTFCPGAWWVASLDKWCMKNIPAAHHNSHHQAYPL